MLAARPAFRNFIPNSVVNGCSTCHVSVGEISVWNAFGQQVRDNLVDGYPNWAALSALDADGDGQANGEELGDPCGVWKQGQSAPRTTNISAPGDPCSVSTTPNLPACTTGGAGGSAGISGESASVQSSTGGAGSNSACEASRRNVPSTPANVPSQASPLLVTGTGVAGSGAGGAAAAVETKSGCAFATPSDGKANAGIFLTGLFVACIQRRRRNS